MAMIPTTNNGVTEYFTEHRQMHLDNLRYRAWLAEVGKGNAEVTFHEFTMDVLPILEMRRRLKEL